MLAAVERHLGGAGAGALQEEEGWESTLAEPSRTPPTRGAFDASTVMGLFESSSWRPRGHPQQPVPEDQLGVSWDLHRAARREPVRCVGQSGVAVPESGRGPRFMFAKE